jgi:hypothetical protein
MFCNSESHPRNICPAKDKTCHNYSKIWHLSRACLNVKIPQQKYGLNTGFVRGDHKVKSQQILTVSPQCHNMVNIHIGEQQTRVLCDLGAQITCINEHLFNSTHFHASSFQKPSVVSIVRAGESIHRVKGQIRLSIRLANIVTTHNCFVIRCRIINLRKHCPSE